MTESPIGDQRPAASLVGITTPDGWTIMSAISRPPGATGGQFSCSYIAERDGESAFLKAIDYVAALSAPDPARALQNLTTAFNFERDLVRACGEQRLENVVRVMADGHLDAPIGAPMNRVSYLVFELAEGDIRRYRALNEQIDIAWALRTVHQATLGLNQLHKAGIAHQDVKPSNLLLFEDGSLGKLGDLGRACLQGGVGPYEHLAVAGDASYAPPEVFYGLILDDWGPRRKACDLFHLGSLLLFQFAGVNAQGAIFAELDQRYWPTSSGGGWNGSFEEVLPYLQNALNSVAALFPSLQDEILHERIVNRFLELCEPDPRRRGHPKDHARRFGDSYSLERYVSYFHALAARAEREITKIVVS